MGRRKETRGRPKTKKVYNYSKTRSTPRSRSSREYDFLQYIRIIFKWGVSTTGLSRPEVEALLYLYPMGVFKKQVFLEFYKTVGMYQGKTFTKFIDEGWMMMWRPRKIGQPALYCLTTKAKIICSKMHSFCTGEKSIPVKTRTNKLLTSKVRIDSYYLDIIYKMNKEREDKKEETDE